MLASLALSALACGHGFTVRGDSDVPLAPSASAARTSSSRGATGFGRAVDGLFAQVVPRDAPLGDGDAALQATPPTSDGNHDPALFPVSLSAGANSTGNSPASRYASLNQVTCEAELGRRRIAFDRVGETRGVVAPLRLKGAIAGVEFHSLLPPAQRRTSPYEIYDCRLVLALDDWARVLARHDVKEVVHYSVYRPPGSKEVLSGAGRRHSGALAIDAALFKLRDGQTLSVEKDFHGHIGSKPCGPDAASSNGLPDSAITLRRIVCEAADAQLFNVLLTPDYNWPHRNHFHLEVTAGVRWVLVR